MSTNDDVSRQYELQRFRRKHRLTVAAAASILKDAGEERQVADALAKIEKGGRTRRSAPTRSNSTPTSQGGSST
jgi:hypothetical protein